MQHRLLAALVIVAAPLAACSSSSTGGGGGGSATSTDSTSICGSDPRAMTYNVGLHQTTTDGTMKASFVDAMPAPPAKGENAWTLTLTDAHGNPVNGATITAKPFMPDHGHGSSVTPLIAPMTDGTYQVSQLDLFMPGIWTVTLTITPTSGPVEVVVFSFCIDG